MGYRFQSVRSDLCAAGRGWNCRLVPAVLFATVCLLVSERASAQVLYGSLVGNVKDSSAAAVAKATVTATNKGTNQSRAVLTDEGGGYSFNDLQSGSTR